MNDTRGFTPRFRFRSQLRELRQLLAPRYSGPMLLLSVPPMHLFTALPSPLRYVVGWRVRQLDSLYIRVAWQCPEDFSHVNYPVVTDPELLARDGYHPGQKSYRYIAEALADKAIPEQLFSGENQAN
ncbi:MAG: hypothetical protein R6W86_12960 [Marinobacter sp.]|uniref:hypothetical protein n=1 Tax=Marinobacter sp. TaxID=50741 RepID=UPI00396E7CE7